MQRRYLFTCALIALAAFSASAPAQSGGSHVIAPATIAGGGATLSGGSFSLSGTVGQPATTTLVVMETALQNNGAPFPGRFTIVVFRRSAE